MYFAELLEVLWDHESQPSSSWSLFILAHHGFLSSLMVVWCRCRAATTTGDEYDENDSTSFEVTSLNVGIDAICCACIESWANTALRWSSRRRTLFNFIKWLFNRENAYTKRYVIKTRNTSNSLRATTGARLIKFSSVLQYNFFHSLTHFKLFQFYNPLKTSGN